ncbi:hypothetical protein CIPAW_09G101200 [Carya illinoinensis]|uniref:Uncharacterized protein n=1 Tax=Carya illinoinensis TaxID=32201 RepID=A0A8T1PJZ4_CARIL|nr:hypothetical protein CIPAW_09G101200 [Carya illinoinensis]
MEVMTQDIQVALHDEIRSACGCRPFEKCDYNSRIAAKVPCPWKVCRCFRKV